MSAKKNKNQLKMADLTPLVKKFEKIIFPCSIINNLSKDNENLLSDLSKTLWTEFPEQIVNILIQELWIEKMIDWNTNDLKSIKKSKETGKVQPQLMIILRQTAKQLNYFSNPMIVEAFYQYLANQKCDVWQIAIILNIAELYFENFDKDKKIVVDLKQLTKENAEQFETKYADLVPALTAAFVFKEYCSAKESILECMSEAKDEFIENQEFKTLAESEQTFKSPMQKWLYSRKVLISRLTWLAHTYGEHLTCFSGKYKSIFEFGDVINEDFCDKKAADLVEYANSLIPLHWIDELEQTLFAITPALSNHDLEIAKDEIAKLRSEEIEQSQSVLYQIILPAIRGEQHPEIDKVNDECLYSVSLFNKIANKHYSLPDKSAKKTVKKTNQKKQELNIENEDDIQDIQIDDDNDDFSALIDNELDENNVKQISDNCLPAEDVVDEIEQEIQIEQEKSQEQTYIDDNIVELPDRETIKKSLNAELTQNSGLYGGCEYKFTDNDMAIIGNVGSLNRIFDNYSDNPCQQKSKKQGADPKIDVCVHKKRAYLKEMDAIHAKKSEENQDEHLANT